MPFGSRKFNLPSIKITEPISGSLLYNSGARASNITPGGFDVDSSGNIYIYDMYSSTLAKLNSSGSIQWQKYITSPAGSTGKGDGQILSLSPDESKVYIVLQQSSIIASLLQFNSSNGTVASNVNSTVTAGNSDTIGTVVSGNTHTYSTVGLTVGGVSRMAVRRHTGGNSSSLPTIPTNVAYHFVTGSAVNDSRITINNPSSPARVYVGYGNTIAVYGSTLSLTASKSLTGGFDSIAATRSIAGLVIMRNNIIGLWTDSSLNTKKWEYTHTVGGNGGDHYYQQGIAVDSTDNIYGCYWNSTAGKIIIYKISYAGVLLWTKSLTPTGHTADSPDAMTLKATATNLYVAFRYGNIDGGGMAIFQINQNGQGTKTFSNNFVLSNETGVLTSSSNITLTTPTVSTGSVSTSTGTTSYTLANASVPTYTQSSI